MQELAVGMAVRLKGAPREGWFGKLAALETDAAGRRIAVVESELSYSDRKLKRMLGPELKKLPADAVRWKSEYRECSARTVWQAIMTVPADLLYEGG